MLKAIFSEVSINALKKGLDASSLRNKVTAHNIANINTPGFKRSSVSFEEHLSQALGQNQEGITRTHERHMPTSADISGVSPQVNLVNSQSLRNDGNNVDIDVEMANLAENTINYQILTRLVASKYAGLQFVISEGRR